MLYLILLILLSIPHISCRYVQSSKYNSNSWTYLDKFCFDEHGGLLSFKFQDIPNSGSQSIAFYVDDQAQWFSTYKSDESCFTKLSKAAKYIKLDAIQNQTITLQVIGSVPHWWYIAVANCDIINGTMSNGVIINGTEIESPIVIPSYTLHMTNDGGKYTYEFSKDEQGVFEMSIFFFILDILLLILLYISKRVAKMRGMNYHVLKFLGVSVTLRALGLICEIIHYGAYANDGIGHPKALNAQFFFEFVGIIIVLLIVLDMAKGWPISTNFIPERRRTFIILFLYFIAYLILFAYQTKMMDPASTLYVYESAPGYALIFFRFLTAIIYSIYMIHTYKLETDWNKKNFYLIFSVFALIWILAQPLLALIAIDLIPSWTRQKLSFGMVNTTQTIAYWAIWLFFMPWRSNKFSLILSPTESRAFGNNNMQVFPTTTTFSTI